MLDMRPGCENCDCSLPANSTKAMICSYECTFCADCAEGVLENVCPNCGGGFVQRPIRVANEWREGISLKHQPATAVKTLKPVDAEKHQSFAPTVKIILAENR